MSRTMTVAALLGLTILTLAGCGSSGLKRPPMEITATAGAGVQTAVITMHSFYFEPNRVVVKVDVPVELTLKKKSFIVPHNFTLNAPEAGIRINQNVGTLKFFPGSRTVRFTPTKAGEYPFACGEDGHAGKGMTGTLIVKP